MVPIDSDIIPPDPTHRLECPYCLPDRYVFRDSETNVLLWASEHLEKKHNLRVDTAGQLAVDLIYLIDVSSDTMDKDEYKYRVERVLKRMKEQRRYRWCCDQDNCRYFFDGTSLECKAAANVHQRFHGLAPTQCVGLEQAITGTPVPLVEETCARPPKGWRCTRGYHADGPCAAVPHRPVTKKHALYLYFTLGAGMIAVGVWGQHNGHPAKGWVPFFVTGLVAALGSLYVAARRKGNWTKDY